MEILGPPPVSLPERLRYISTVKRCFLRLFILLTLMLFFSTTSIETAHAEERSPSEWSIKLAFIYNFAKFIQWPAGIPSSELVIGVMGQAAGPELSDQKKEVAGRRVILRHVQRIEQARECHIVFVPAAEKGLLPQVIKTLEGRPVVTVGDFDGFLRAGGMINLVPTKGRLNFDINVGATKKAGVTVGYQLLRLARELTG